MTEAREEPPSPSSHVGGAGVVLAAAVLLPVRPASHALGHDLGLQRAPPRSVGATASLGKEHMRTTCVTMELTRRPTRAHPLGPEGFLAVAA